jgi:periplasmic protein TonB
VRNATTMPEGESLFSFMPYGAPELKEVARKYMFRGVLVGCGAFLMVFLLSFGTSAFLRSRPHETSVIVVPYRELAAPPPLTQNEPPPQVQVAVPVTPPTVGVAVPVPDAEAPPEQTIASQEEIAQTTPGVSSEGDLVVAPPSDDDLPKLGDYVYVEELPEAVTKVPPEYPELARSANVDGTVLVQALVGKDGRVKDAKVVKSIPMLDASALAAVKLWVFKPALSNNKPVAVWVAVPVRFTLH